MFANGVLRVDFISIDFESQPLEQSRMIRIDEYNLRTDFTLRLLWSEVIAVEPYEVPRVRMPLPGDAVEVMSSLPSVQSN